MRYNIHYSFELHSLQSYTYSLGESVFNRLRKNRTFKIVIKSIAATVFAAVSLIAINELSKVLWPSFGLDEGFRFGAEYPPIPLQSQIVLWILSAFIYAGLCLCLAVAFNAISHETSQKTKRNSAWEI